MDFDTFMEYAMIVLQMFGGVGVFMVGMNMMSASMTKLAHGKLRTLLNKTTANRFAGVGIGAGVTMIIQSSAATTVMVVGLVNAGILTLFQATSIIMGANIGTTITAYIASFSAVDISAFLFVLAVVGVFMEMLSKNDKVKIFGNILAGLGLIFVGLEFMSNAISGNEVVTNAISAVFSVINNPLLLLIVGAVITALVQSSSAVTSVITVLVANGVLSGDTDTVLYIIIGSNIGTCVTALISSIGASVNARRAAVIHLLFNCSGALVFTVFLLLWGLSGTSFSGQVLSLVSPKWQIAVFHTLFNLVGTCLFLPLIKCIVWLAEHLVREKKTAKDETSTADELLAIPDQRLLRSPSVALGYIYQKTGKVLGYAMSALDMSVTAFLNKDDSVKEKVGEINANLAQISKQDVDYLVKLSSENPAMEDEATISSLHYVLNDIARIGELADNVTKYTDHYVKDELVFSEDFLSMIKVMYGKIGELYTASLDAYLTKDRSKLAEVDKLEDAIDKDRRELVAAHIVRLKEGKCQPQNSNIFINLVGNLERAADHITFIAHSIENNAEKKSEKAQRRCSIAAALFYKLLNIFRLISPHSLRSLLA